MIGNEAAPLAQNNTSSPIISPALPHAPADQPAGRSLADLEKRSDIPQGLWMRCPQCEAMLFKKNVEQNLQVCPECDHHFRIGGDERASQLCDPGSFEPMWEELRPMDPLSFYDLKSYKRRLAEDRKKTGHHDALLCGKGYIQGRGVILACLDSRFIMGTMGSVMGEKIARCTELAIETDLPLIIISCSGGARMQEAILAVVQMSKTAAAIARLDEAGGLFISVLSDPTTGGVTASFAMLGDVILAEPKAMICFAGPRVIANTIRQQLPDGFQRAEHLLKKGFVDRMVHRRDLRSEISRIIDYAGK